MKDIEKHKELPRGSKKRIVELTGLSYQTVIGYFNGKNCNYKTIKLIDSSIKKIKDELSIR